ncbi:hypothetical protein BHE74_00020127 [Ensete ventricosum]|nr:hypothetical protein BHE74_00020127 [Ensete ventricosum]
MARFLLHLLLLVSSLFFHFTTSADAGTRAHDFSAVLYFGDSTLDTGNNGYIPTVVRGNHPPYGRDFPGSVATGRLSNGLLVPDLLCSELGIKQLSPPFMHPNISDDDIRTGVNFASAGSGFDNATSVLLNTIPISRQSEMFEEYLVRLKRVAGEEDAKRIVSDALFLVSAGTNDLVLNYYDLPSATRAAMTIDEYQDFLLQTLHKFLEHSYDLGGRRFIVAGLPPIGCLPFQMTLSVVHSVVRTCVDEQNSDAQHYNSKLKQLLRKTQQSLPGSKFVYLDLYGFLMEVLNNAANSSPEGLPPAMMSSAPSLPPLPISNPPASAAAPVAPSSAAPVSTPAFRLFLSRLSDSVGRSLSNRRPWSELADRSAFTRPDSLSDATYRLRKNLTYFRVNYAAVVAAVLAISLITNPFSLVVLLALLAAWCLLYLFRPSDPPLVILGRNFSDRETLGSLVLITVFVVFLTSVGSLLISALVAGAAIVGAHGAFRVPEDLFLDEQETGAASSLLSFLGGAASSAASAGPAVVAAARV